MREQKRFRPTRGDAELIVLGEILKFKPLARKQRVTCLRPGQVEADEVAGLAVFEAVRRALGGDPPAV